jgi:hypothetical protein
MTLGTAWTWARAGLGRYRTQLRFCLRMTAAALLAFALAQVWNIPLQRETRNPGERRCRALAGRPESVYGYTEFCEAASVMSSCSSTTG